MTATIDSETFSALRDATGSEFVRELIDTFLVEAPSMLADLRESLANGESDRFRRAAHSLKSNGNTFGALALGAIARDLEISGMAQVKTRAGAPLAGIEAEYARVAAALSALRDE
jgi:HPt (histidine-containing phosphotransfer) domain-containing protein